jgi:hypothetical protein
VTDQTPASAPVPARDAPGGPGRQPDAPEAPQTAPDGFPDIQGRCPACGGSSLFVGSGGYITCRRIDCPEPDAATKLLHGDAQDQLTRALGRERAARVIAHTLHGHGHTLAAVQSMTDEQLLAVPGIQEASLALIRARIPAPAATETTEPATITDPEWLRQQYAAAIWERQNPGRSYVDCEYRWKADAEADADAVMRVRDRHLAQLRQRLQLADVGLDEPTPEGTGGRQAGSEPLATRAALVRDQAALAQIRLLIAAHRPRLQLADPILLGKLDRALEQPAELEAAVAGER